MRLVLIISSMGCGGAERVMSRMANFWAEKGWNITIVTVASRDKDFYPLHSKIQRRALDLIRPSRNPLEGFWFNLLRIFKLRSEIKKIRPDAVISFMDFTNVRSLLATCGLCIPVIVSERNAPSQKKISRLWGLVRQLVYHRATQIVVQTERAARFFPSDLQRRISVIPNPVADVVSQRLNGTYRCITAMGSLTPQKAFPFLIRSFSQIAAICPGWILKIIGEGPERGALEALIQELKLDDRVLLCGRLADPRRELCHSDIFVLSSDYEGFPNALLEAMSMGLACIATDCETGPNEMIHSGETGLLIPVQSVEGLSAALCRLIQEETLRWQMGTAARADVLRRFGMDRIMRQWEALLPSAEPISIGI